MNAENEGMTSHSKTGSAAPQVDITRKKQMKRRQERVESDLVRRLAASPVAAPPPRLTASKMAGGSLPSAASVSLSSLGVPTRTVRVESNSSSAHIEVWTPSAITLVSSGKHPFMY
jgi:hypothetical protein